MRIKTTAAVIVAGFIMPLTLPAHASSNMAGDVATTSALPIAVNNSYTVQLNKTQIVYLPEAASAVVVGNPDIADISVHSSDTLFIVGRGFGETNIIVLNKSGHTIMDSQVQVINSGSQNNVRVYSGGGVVRATYNCAPYCQPAPILGDDNLFISANKTKAKEITNTYATGGTATQPQTASSATEIPAAGPATPPESRTRRRVD